jgi:hypothetical protein
VNNSAHLDRTSPKETPSFREIGDAAPGNAELANVSKDALITLASICVCVYSFLSGGRNGWP